MFKEILIAFGMVAVCVSFHAASMIGLAESVDKYIKKRGKFGFFHETGILIFTFGAILIFHVIGASIWAVFYLIRGLFPDFETSMYFSLTSYTTMGFGDVVLPERWRILGGVEGFTGVLLCGMSTAFLFVIVKVLLKVRRGKKNLTIG